MSFSTVIAWVAALALLAIAHHLFWRWKLHAPSREDELVRAKTRDGWTLALGRRRPRAAPRRPPVLLVHGIAMNRQAFDFGVERYSIAAYLARSGFDCFALDLRGHGGSRRGPTSRWTLDSYLQEDLPAALDAIREATGEGSVLYVGHSQGAMLGMAACALYPARIRGLVTLAGPVHFDAQPRLRALVALSRLGVGRFLRVLARMVAPFSGYWHPAPFEVSINMRNVERPIYRRLLANAIEDLQPGVLEHFAVCIRDDTFRSCDGTIDYRALFPSCTQPALFIAGERDGLAPPPVVEAAFRRWGGPKRYWSCGRDYGHADVLLGRSAPEVVFPMIRDFLLEHSDASALSPGAVDSVVSIRGVTKRFGAFTALDRVDLEIRAGEIFALLGPNGAGKTTLISIVAGLLRATAGEVRVLGHDVVAEYGATRRVVGLVPQEINFDPFFTVEEALRIQAGYFNVRLSEERLVEILSALDLLAKRTANSRTLSGGMKRRLLIGKALVHDPRVLFLDEPTAGVDVELRRALWRYVGTLRDRGTTVVLTTHYLEEAEELADRVGIIDHGRLLVVEEKRSLLRRHGAKTLRLALAQPIATAPPPLAALGARLAPDGAALEVEIPPGAAAGPVLAAVAAAGLAVDDVDTRRTTLEDVFVRLVGAAPREGGA